MKRGVLLAVCMMLLLCQPAWGGTGVRAPEGLKAPDVLTPEFLRESCYNYGAVNTVRVLTKPGSSHWADLLAHIAGGEVNWIIYVPLFASGTEAGQATQLTIALAEALRKNPHAVLSLEYSFVSLRGVCSLPFINPGEEFIRQYYQDVMDVMQEIKDPYMKTDKEICLTRLRIAVDTAQKRLDATRKSGAK